MNLRVEPLGKSCQYGSFIPVSFSVRIFFFQRENETEKLLYVLEVPSLQYEKCGVWAEPLKLRDREMTRM